MWIGSNRPEPVGAPLLSAQPTEAAERKRKEAEQRRLAELEQKRKEAELMAKLETSPPEVVAKYSNASLANGSTY